MFLIILSLLASKNLADVDPFSIRFQLTQAYLTTEKISTDMVFSMPWEQTLVQLHG